jgi:hypothetical protein
VGDFVHRRTDGRDRGRSYRRSPNRLRPSCPASGLRELGRTRNECRAESRPLGKREIAIAGRRVQGIVPAPEPNHAIQAVIDEAIRAREAGESKVIPFNLCGHGHFDMQAYHAFLAGRLPEIEFEEAALADGLTSLPEIPVPG